MSFAERLHTAISHHRNGEIGPAEEIYLELLREDPDNPNVLHFLGVLNHLKGAHQRAIELIEGSVTRAPEYVDAWNSLGNLYRFMDRLDDAEAAYRRALVLNENHAGAWNNLALILRDKRLFPEAVAAHRRVIELAPDEADAHYNYANTLRAYGNPDEAIAAYRTALALHPGHSGAHSRFGYLLYLIGRKRDAEDVYRSWVAADPENAVARHMLAAVTGEDVPERASEDYVRETFDRFAASFDEVLLERLGYRAPELMAQALAEVVGEPAATLDVLDAGCGTGLCAPHLRPFARRLTGVDLSPRMIQKAIARGGYDHIHVGELTAFLEDSPGSFDVIASADTLVYFGVLGPVCAAAARALRPAGWFVFTLERNEEGVDYVLGPHGRFAHGEAYVRGTLAEAGFEAVSVTPVVARTEVGADVPGHLVRARSSDTTSG